MKFAQTGSATTAPAMRSPSDTFASNPTHTPATICGVNPTNQASAKFCVVPVLPAAGRVNRIGKRRAELPVPFGSSITDWSMSTITPAVSAERATVSRPWTCSSSTSPSRSITRRMPTGETWMPPFGNVP